MSACLSSPISVLAARPGRHRPVPVRFRPICSLRWPGWAIREPAAGCVTGWSWCWRSGSAVLAGARTFTAIAEWARLPGRAHPAGGGPAGTERIDPPPVLQAVDADDLDRAVSAWLQARSAASAPTPAVRVIAVDGKTARGARGRTAPPRICSRPSTRAPGWSSDRPQWTARPTRSPRSPRCWTESRSPTRSSPPTRCTAPARHLPDRPRRALPAHRQTQPARPAPAAACAALGGHPRPRSDPRQGPRPGRSAPSSSPQSPPASGSPAPRLAAQIIRRRRGLTNRRWRTETAYAITDLTGSATSSSPRTTSQIRTNRQPRP